MYYSWQSCSPGHESTMSESIVYKARVTAGMEKKECTGLTATTFKQRYYNHQSSFRHRQHEKDTRLSQYVWTKKDEGKACSIQWARYTAEQRPTATKAKGATCAWRKNWHSRKHPSTSLSTKGVSLCQSVATRIGTTFGTSNQGVVKALLRLPASNHTQPSPN